MDHQAFAQLLGNYGEFAGAIAVFATLFYLAMQIRNSTQQNQRDAIRHSWDSLNASMDRFSESIETASIVNRGREDRESLDSHERLIFEFIHLRVLNTLESWYLLLGDVRDNAFVEQQHQNIADLVDYFLNYPSTREIWNENRHTFAPQMRSLVDETLAG